MLRKLLAIGSATMAALFAQSNTVTVTNINNGSARTAASSVAGEFEIPLLPPGSYSVGAESAGFKRLERSGLRLDAGQRAKIDFRLEVGEVAERVEVNAGAP